MIYYTVRRDSPSLRKKGGENMDGLGTIVNVLAILVAGGVGVLFRGKMAVKYQRLLLEVVGLVAMVVGAYGLWDSFFALEDHDPATSGTLLVLISLLVGAAFGEALQIQKGLDKLGHYFRKKSEGQEAKEAARARAKQKKKADMPVDPSTGKRRRRSLSQIPVRDLPDTRTGHLFTDGFALATVLCTINAMAFNGAFADGMEGDTTLLFIKSAIDAAMVLALATVYGGGVTFAALPVLILEGGVTLVALFKDTWLVPELMSQFSLISSIILIAAGFGLCFGKKIRAVNLTPALLIPPLYTFILNTAQTYLGE